MILSKGSITIFLTHPISAIFLAAAFTVLILPSVTKNNLERVYKWKSERKGKRNEDKKLR